MLSNNGTPLEPNHGGLPAARSSIPPPPLFNDPQQPETPRTPRNKATPAPFTQTLRPRPPTPLEPCTPFRSSPFRRPLNLNLSTPATSSATKRKATTINTSSRKRQKTATSATSATVSVFGVGPSVSLSNQSALPSHAKGLSAAGKQKSGNARVDVWACMRAITEREYEPYINGEPIAPDPPLLRKPPSTKFVGCLFCE